MTAAAAEGCSGGRGPVPARLLCCTCPPTHDLLCSSTARPAPPCPTPPLLQPNQPQQIHTSKMSTNSFLGRDVDLAELASRTKNFSGAEIEGLVKSATSFALNRQVDVTDLTKPIDEEAIKVGGLLWVVRVGVDVAVVRGGVREPIDDEVIKVCVGGGGGGGRAAAVGDAGVCVRRWTSQSKWDSADEC